LKLPKETAKQVIEEIEAKIPDYPKGIELQDWNIKITGIMLEKKDSIYIEIEQEKEES
jgi:hypothetical protein